MHHAILLNLSCSTVKNKKKTEHKSQHASAAGVRNKKADAVSCDTLAASAQLSSELQYSLECSKWLYIALIQVPLEELKAFCRQQTIKLHEHFFCQLPPSLGKTFQCNPVKPCVVVLSTEYKFIKELNQEESVEEYLEHHLYILALLQTTYMPTDPSFHFSWRFAAIDLILHCSISGVWTYTPDLSRSIRMLLFDGLRHTDCLLRVAEHGENELLFLLLYTSKNVSDVLDMTRILLFAAIIYLTCKNAEK